MANLELRKKKDLSSFRKIALGTWRTTYDPSVYGTLTVRMDDAARYLEQFRAATGKKLTYSHMMAKAAAMVLQKMPDANAILRLGRIYLRKRIGVFFQVAMKDPKTNQIDLSGTVIHDPEQKSLEDIVDEFETRVRKVRTGQDEELESTRSTMRRVPFFMMHRLLRTISFMSYTLNMSLKWAGVPKDPFGSVMITNIGSLGLEQAYVPLVPYSRVPLLIAMGAVEDVPLVDDGEIVIGKIMRICATFDHRVLDGKHTAIMARTLREWMEHPFDHFDPLPDATDQSGADTSPKST